MGTLNMVEMRQLVGEQVWQGWQRYRQRVRSRVTTANSTLEQVLAAYTKDALTGMARELIPSGGWSSLRKADLIAALRKVLLDQDLLALVVWTVDQEEREALQFVLKRGGTVLRETFCEHYGDESEDSPYWNRHRPMSLLGRLRLRGLLTEALVEGEALVLVASELRGPLRALLF